MNLPGEFNYSGKPVVVIGNGPVGQTTALLLARWGIPVVVLDQRTERDLVGSKAICQQRDVLDVWSSVGAGEQIAAEGLTWTTVRTFYREHELFNYELQDLGNSRFPPFVNISQCRTEEILDEKIAAQPLIEVRWGHDVSAIDQDADEVRLRCGTAEGEVTITAPYVVSCAGAKGSLIRKSLDVSFEGVSFDDRFLICDIRTDLPGWESERRFYFDPEWNPGRQVLIHPCPNSTFRIDWQVPAEYSLEEDELAGGLDARIRHIVGDQPYDIVWKSVYRFQSRIVDRMHVGRVLLAGDCAHLVAPFGARGLNSGVADAENAAWKIAFVLRGFSPATILSTYHDERHAAAVENLDVTTATMDFLVPQDEQQWQHRRAILEHSVSSAETRAQVDSGRLSEPFWYSQSPLTTCDAGRPVATRPPRGGVQAPAPGVIVPDVPLQIDHDATTLRMIARAGILLLTGISVGDIEPLHDWPVRILSIGHIDPDGHLATALGIRSDEIWVIRPDAHIAAIVGNQADLERAVSKLLGLSLDRVT
ncbi:MAG: FAD-dependent monooxygenase [Antricoccus sp.]